ncbi:Glycosyl transferase CAP10 domain [Dillenia turbinata]|uniref:Glycosyl transferase CAP10 domain n=1 Tax=Dillenia turbinata TaxID=194707 RepID=A0AAN8Z5D2_9MAGN
MGVLPSSTTRIKSYARRHPFFIIPFVAALCFFSLTAIFLFKVDDVAYQTKTVAGHNLEPTPWHLFPPKTFGEETKYSRASKIIHCNYLACPRNTFNNYDTPQHDPSHSSASNNDTQCPEFYRWIHRDLEPWSKSKIQLTHLMEAQKRAAFRVTIVGGRLYVDLYFACVQSRQMFTIWGIFQLLRRYPGMIPDVDIMFDCMDKPSISRSEHQSMPLPLFRYCTTPQHFDIPFPDWSFWGWPEVNIAPWDEEFRDIKRGSEVLRWNKKWSNAYWKGNPDVGAPVRTALLKCNDTRKWGAQIMRQNWLEEVKSGFKASKLSNQCNHRYKIYAEGFAWSVSLKYILSCSSLALIISPEYQDFFNRGLIPKENYWPISTSDICRSIKFAVDWGNSNPKQAERMGREGQKLMETLDMNRVYDYMYHLILEYSKLLDFEPSPPPSALEVCAESLLCHADSEQRETLERSTAFPSAAPPCTLPPPDSGLIDQWIQMKIKTISDLELLEKKQM